MTNYADFSQALFEFWSLFGLDVYRTGFVPEDAPFPYVTFEVIQGDFGQKSNLFAFAWFQQKPGMNVNLERATFCKAVQEQLPHDGVKIVTPSGLIWLQRQEKRFIEDYYANEEIKGEPVVGARISYVATTY